MKEHTRVTFEQWRSSGTAKVAAHTSGLVITDDEVATFLAAYADMMHLKPCPFPHCPGCEEAQRYWWDWCNSLCGPVRVRLQKHLLESDIPLPFHPGDDIDVVPTALN
jgi:hypothetical protein